MVWLVSWSDFVWFAPGVISGLVWFSVRAKTSRRSHAEEPHTTPGYVWQSTRARPVWRHVGSAGSAWSEPGGRRSPTTASASWCLSTATRLKFDRCLTPTLWGGGVALRDAPGQVQPDGDVLQIVLEVHPVRSLRVIHNGIVQCETEDLRSVLRCAGSVRWVVSVLCNRGRLVPRYFETCVPLTDLMMHFFFNFHFLNIFFDCFVFPTRLVFVIFPPKN